MEACEYLFCFLLFSDLSFVNPLSRDSLRKFPSLVNCTTIDWFSEWPADALKSVASRFLQDLEFDTERTRAAVEDMCMVFHQTVRTLAVDFQRSVSAVREMVNERWIMILRCWGTYVFA